MGLSFLLPIICLRTSLYLAALAELLLPPEGNAVTLWSQNRTLARGTCLWQYISCTTMVKSGAFSFVPHGSWMVKHVFFCERIKRNLRLKSRQSVSTCFKKKRRIEKWVKHCKRNKEFSIARWPMRQTLTTCLRLKKFWIFSLLKGLRKILE